MIYILTRLSHACCSIYTCVDDARPHVLHLPHPRNRLSVEHVVAAHEHFDLVRIGDNLPLQASQLGGVTTCILQTPKDVWAWPSTLLFRSPPTPLSPLKSYVPSSPLDAAAAVVVVPVPGSSIRPMRCSSFPRRAFKSFSARLRESMLQDEK